MPRRKPAPATHPEPPAEPTGTAASPDATPIADSQETDFPFGALDGTVAETPPADAPPAEGPLPASGPDEPARPRPDTKPGSRPQVRSWTRDTALGYRILTDDLLKVIVLRFDQKPADEVLDLVKAKGFKYRDLRTHGRVWVTPNDWEGRTLADQLDQELYRHRTGGPRPDQGVA